MKKLLLPLAVLGIAVPAMASAVPANVTGTVTIDGSVAPRCQFTTGTATITIPELSDTSTGVLDPTTVAGKNANLVGWCNGTKSTMTANATSLTNGTTPPPGFSNQVDFTATATANGQSSIDSDSTDGLAGTTAMVGIFSGNINVALSAAATHGGSTLKLVAGAYTGSVLVTLAPAN